jgi:hypothetical membrane protein
MTTRVIDKMSGEFISQLCFIVAGLIFVPLMFFFMPEGKFPPGSTPHEWFRIGWWLCMAITFLILLRARAQDDSIIGTILVTIFGPVALMSIIFRKAVKRKWGR